MCNVKAGVNVKGEYKGQESNSNQCKGECKDIKCVYMDMYLYT